MSLISLLRGDTTTSSSDVALNTLTQKLAARQSVALSKVETGGTGTSGTATAGSSGVLITQAARQALAARTDADTPAETLADEARATLDKQYGSSGKAADPDMAAFSNRALSLVVLNEDGGFSRQEVATARAELQSRDRHSLLEAIAASGLSAASLTSWQNQQLIARQNMSAEEAQLRDSGGALR